MIILLYVKYFLKHPGFSLFKSLDTVIPPASYRAEINILDLEGKTCIKTAGPTIMLVPLLCL